MKNQHVEFLKLLHLWVIKPEEQPPILWTAELKKRKEKEKFPNNNKE